MNLNQPIRTAFAAILFAALYLFGFSLQAKTEDIVQFDKPEDAERYNRLTHELRCLVCQNQTIGDSDAELAGDLRREVYTMVDAGQSDQNIVDFLVNRYGDFVLYRPPIKASTLLLWFGPGSIVLMILLTLWIKKRKQQVAQDMPLSANERKQLTELLQKAKDPQP